MQDAIKLAGFLEIRIYDSKTKKLLKIIGGKNLLVNGMADAFGALFSYTDFSAAIGKIALGTGSTAPTVGDTSLEAQVISKDCSAINYSSTLKEISANATITTSEANGYVLREAGLLTRQAAPTLLARKVFPAITKTADISFDVIWRIRVLLS